MGNNIEKIEKLAQKGKAEKILAFLKSKDKETRLAAIRALGKCHDNEEAVNNLTSMMNMVTDKEERIALFESLGQLGKEQSFFHISHYVDKETDPDVAAAMRKAMAMIHQHHD